MQMLSQQFKMICVDIFLLVILFPQIQYIRYLITFSFRLADLENHHYVANNLHFKFLKNYAHFFLLVAKYSVISFVIYSQYISGSIAFSKVILIS